MEKCNCEFCKFPITGAARDVSTFVNQVSAKRQILSFLKDSFEESDEKKKAKGYAENKIGILLGEWGLGKTQLLKYFRTAINNSAGVLNKLVGEIEDDEKANLLISLDLNSVLDELEEESPEFEADRSEYDFLFGKYKGIVFRIDATKFRNELNPGQNVLVTLWNLILCRCNVEGRIETDDQIISMTKTILDKFEVDRIFILFDELEGLKGVESAGFEFDAFFQDFALQIKRVLDNEVTSDVSIILAVIPTVWEDLMRQFETLGALESRSVFIDLKRLDLKRAYQLILSRCGTLDNSPFSEGTVRTFLHASASNPRYFSRLCRYVQSDLKINQTNQYKYVLNHLKDLTESSRKHYTYDQRGFDELLDGALIEYSEDKPHVELLGILTGEIREVSPYELRESFEVKNVALIQDALEDLCNKTITGIYPVSRVMKLDNKKILMSQAQINKQKQIIENVGWLDANDIQIETQRLKIYNMDYQKDILGVLATYKPETTNYEYYLPVSNSRLDELRSLWRLEEPSIIALFKTLQVIGKTNIQKYRLSHAAIERVYPWHRTKEPPFEWVPESFWHDAHAYLHDPRTHKEEMYELLMDGLMSVAMSMKASCNKLDRYTFRMELAADLIDHSSYDDDKSVSYLVTFVSDESEIDSEFMKRQFAEQSIDFLVCISHIRLRQKHDRLEAKNGRPSIEVVYYELDSKTQFKLQLLAYLGQNALDQSWYMPDKLIEASKILSHDCLGNVIDLWIQKITENGYLIRDWELDEASIKEPRRPLRAIRDVISILPSLPVSDEKFDVELKHSGLREKIDSTLFGLLKTNRQIIITPSGEIDFVLLPTQKRIIELIQKVKPSEDQKIEEFTVNIQKHFWRGRRSNIERELNRHITIVESLGYFDSDCDLDSLINKIKGNIDIVLAEEDDASIDQYAFQIRRAKGDIGAKGAKRLQDELSYYEEHYERHRDEIRVLQKHPEWLKPRVIRRRLIEINRDVGEIIAVGKSPFEEGKRAVAKAQRELHSAHHSLASSGTDIKIRDHVIALKNHNSHPLLEEAKQAHKTGKIHDEKKGLKSASDVLFKIEEELKKLYEEKNQVQTTIQSYRDDHQLLISKTKVLSEKRGVVERIAPISRQLKKLEPKEMRLRFKDKFEGEGLKQGLEEVQKAQQELISIKKETSKIEEFLEDLAAC